MSVRSFGLLALGAAALVFPTACGTDAVGVDPCRQIEEARCRQAPTCGVQLEPPNSNDGNDVAACIRFYDDACLHGLEVPAPGNAIVNGCVQAIQAASPATPNGCAVVVAPESNAACSWLIPPQSSTTDASDAPTDTADAAADATVATDATTE
jgi:hypothetical protein